MSDNISFRLRQIADEVTGVEAKLLGARSRAKDMEAERDQARADLREQIAYSARLQDELGEVVAMLRRLAEWPEHNDTATSCRMCGEYTDGDFEHDDNCDLAALLRRLEGEGSDVP